MLQTPAPSARMIYRDRIKVSRAPTALPRSKITHVFTIRCRVGRRRSGPGVVPSVRDLGSGRAARGARVRMADARRRGPSTRDRTPGTACAICHGALAAAPCGGADLRRARLSPGQRRRQADRERIERAAESQRWPSFYQSWTYKEALAKALGEGVFGLPFDRILVSPDGR